MRWLQQRCQIVNTHVATITQLFCNCCCNKVNKSNPFWQFTPSEIAAKGQAERQADKHTDRRTYLKTDRQTEGKTDIPTERKTVEQTDIHTDTHKDKQTDRYTERQTERQADRQIDKETNREKDRHTNRPTYSRTDRQLVVRARPRQIDIKQVVIRYLIDAWLVNLQLRRLTESSPSAGPGPDPLSSMCSPLYISDPQTAARPIPIKEDPRGLWHRLSN